MLGKLGKMAFSTMKGSWDHPMMAVAAVGAIHGASSGVKRNESNAPGSNWRMGLEQSRMEAGRNALGMGLGLGGMAIIKRHPVIGLGLMAGGAGVGFGIDFNKPRENSSMYQKAMSSGSTSNVSSVFSDSTMGLAFGMHNGRHGS